MNDFKKLREQSGMNMKQFAAHFEIPYRTIQNWEAGVNKCPEYLLKLMKYKLVNGLIRKTEKHWIEGEDDMICPVCLKCWNYCDNNTEDFIHCPCCGEKLVHERGGEDAAD